MSQEREEASTHRGGLLGFGHTQELEGVQSLLERPVVGDGDGDDRDVRHPRGEEHLQDGLQKA